MDKEPQIPRKEAIVSDCLFAGVVVTLLSMLCLCVYNIYLSSKTLEPVLYHSPPKQTWISDDSIAAPPQIAPEPPQENATNAAQTFFSEEDVQQYAVDFLATTTDEFNSRYGSSLETPKIEFTAPHRGYYDPGRGVIVLPPISLFWGTDSDNYWLNKKELNEFIKHEFCHYMQHSMCIFPKAGESFCEVFAGTEHTATDCSEGGYEGYYCYPYRLELLEDGQGFIDCVISKCGEDLIRSEMDACYKEWAIDA